MVLALTLTTAQAEIYTHSQLRGKDLDDMTEAVNAKMSQAKKLSASSGTEGEAKAVELLREALKLVLSRPDTANDKLVSKIFPTVQIELSRYKAFEDTLASVVNEAIYGIKNKVGSVDQQVTYYVLLENFMGEMQPEAHKSEIRALYEKIKESDLEVSKEVNKALRRSMYKKYNLQAVAEAILKRTEVKPVEKSEDVKD